MLVKLEACHNGEYWCSGDSGFTQGNALEELLDIALLDIAIVKGSLGPAL